MRQVTCKNCGAVFDETLEKCPYCGTMNRKGSYGSFRRKVAGMVDRMLGLRNEVNQSTGSIVLSAFLRSLIMIAAVIGLAFLFSRSARIGYYYDPKSDQEAYEKIVWEDENIDKLNEAYERNDFKTIRSLYAENSNVVSRWPHYADYKLKEKYADIIEYTRISNYQLQDVLYFLYFPGYYSSGTAMKTVDAEQYESLRESVLNMMEEKGYTEQELSDIYGKNSNSYGYLSASDLNAYVKE